MLLPAPYFPSPPCPYPTHLVAKPEVLGAEPLTHFPTSPSGWLDGCWMYKQPRALRAGNTEGLTSRLSSHSWKTQVWGGAYHPGPSLSFLLNEV